MSNLKKAMKYASEHLACGSSCQLAAHKEAKRPSAYRFTRLEKVTKEDFYPVAKLDPKRTFKSRPEECHAWALSLFDTRLNAEKKLKSILAIAPNFPARFICRVSVTKNDGVVSNPNGSGHYRIHEYADSDIHSTASAVQALP